MKTPIVAEAHCDAPCGVYDPASARIAAEAVQSMTKKMLAMTCPDTSDGVAMAAYMNTMARYARQGRRSPKVQRRTPRSVDGFLQASTS